ncbi:MAG: class I SAM-dependent methyltransferase, partial [Candidatus Nanopelagicales bacterium]
MPDWADWQQSPWGRLRYIQAEANLVPFLTTAPMNILDVAGGNGVEALRLAKMGHHVTVVDYSEQMLEAAQRAMSETGMADRISLVHANVESMQASLSRTGYDGALCHNLIQYLDDPQSALRNIADCLRSDGFL